MFCIGFSSLVEEISEGKTMFVSINSYHLTTMGLYLNNHWKIKGRVTKEAKCLSGKKSLTSSANFPALEDPEHTYQQFPLPLFQLITIRPTDLDICLLLEYSDTAQSSIKIEYNQVYKLECNLVFCLQVRAAFMTLFCLLLQMGTSLAIYSDDFHCLSLEVNFEVASKGT